MAKDLDTYFDELPGIDDIEDLAGKKKKKKKPARERAMRLLKKRKEEMDEALKKVKL